MISVGYRPCVTIDTISAIQDEGEVDWIVRADTYRDLLSDAAQEDLNERSGTSGWEFDRKEVKNLRDLIAEQNRVSLSPQSSTLVRVMR